jgi:hypothetical protein
MPKSNTIYSWFHFLTADSHEATALPMRQNNANKAASREPATDRQLRMTTDLRPGVLRVAP